MAEKHYSLVKFLEEDGDDLIEIVPTKWLIGKDKAYWPSKKGSRDKITRWIMSQIDPETSWDQFPIVLKHQYSTYNNARKGLVKAEEETNRDSNVSDCEVSRKKKKPVRFESDNSDNDVFSKRQQTIGTVISESEDDLNQKNAYVKSVLRDKVQSMLQNVSSRKRKPFSEQCLNRVGKQNKNDNTILKNIYSDSKRTKRIVAENTAEDNASKKYHYQHMIGIEKNNRTREENITSSCNITKHRGAKKAHEHDGLSMDNYNNPVINERRTLSREGTSSFRKSTIDISVAGQGDIKDIREDISANSADSAGDNNEELTLTRRASILPSCGFTPPPGSSNRSDDNFDVQNSHSFTLDDASPAGHNRPSLQLTPSSQSLLSLKPLSSSPSSPLSQPSSKIKSLAKNTVVTSKPSAVQLVRAELLQEMSSKVDIILINLEKILRKLFPGEHAVLRPKNLPQLPLQTHDAFNAFEKFLQNDTNFNAAVDYFASLSRADTEKSAVGKLLPKIISNSLARIVNWAGSGKIKLGVQGTTLHEALQCAILKNFPKSDLQVATGSMKRWFHTSNQRKV